MTSWVRYKLGQMVGIHLKTDSEQGINAWWKNIHRAGKVALHLCKTYPVREVFNNRWRFAGHPSRLKGAFHSTAVAEVDYYRWEFVQPMDPVGSNNHHEGRLNVNRWDQHLTRVFPIPYDELRSHNNEDHSSVDIGSLLPTGWHLLASDQPHWKQLRDETVTLMMNNLQLNLQVKHHEIKQSLVCLQAAGHMRNVTLSSDVGGVTLSCLLPMWIRFLLPRMDS